MSLEAVPRPKNDDLCSIREARLDDVARLYELCCNFLRETDRSAECASEDAWRRQIQDPDGCVFVVESHDLQAGGSSGFADGRPKIIGYLAGRLLAPSVHLAAELGLIDSVVVHGSFHHLGLGQRLVRSALEWFRAKQVRGVRLSVSAENQKAQDFFEKFGFKAHAIQYRLDIG